MEADLPLACKKTSLYRVPLAPVFMHFTDTDGTVTFTTRLSRSPLLPCFCLIVHIPCKKRNDHVWSFCRYTRYRKNKDCHKERRRVFLGTTQDPHRQPNAKDEEHHWAQLVGTIDKIRGRRIRNTLGPSPRWRNFALYSENCRKQNARLLFIEAIQGHGGARVQPFFPAAYLRVRPCDKLRHVGYVRYETATN